MEYSQFSVPNFDVDKLFSEFNSALKRCEDEISSGAAVVPVGRKTGCICSDSVWNMPGKCSKTQGLHRKKSWYVDQKLATCHQVIYSLAPFGMMTTFMVAHTRTHRLEDDVGAKIPCSSAAECADKLYSRSMRMQDERGKCAEAEAYLARMAHDMNATLTADIVRSESQVVAFNEWLETMSQQNQIMVEEVSLYCPPQVTYCTTNTDKHTHTHSTVCIRDSIHDLTCGSEA